MSLLLLYTGGAGAPPGPPPPVILTPTFGVARCRYIVEVAWTDYAAGLLTFDFSTFDGTDVFAATTFDETFGGPLDDVSNDVTGITYTRGRSSDLQRVEEGRCTLRLFDPDGKYNRQNPSSVLAGKLTPMRACRVRAIDTLGVTVGLYSGWIRRITYEPNGRRGEAQIECSDLIMRMQRDKPTIPETGSTTTGQLVGLFLDSIGFTSPTLRSIETGDGVPTFVGDGATDSLTHIGNLLAVEGGFFFQSGAGVATYHSRHWRDIAPAVGVIENAMKALGTGVDLDAIVNKWTVTRTGGLPQTAINDASVAQYGEIPESIESAYLLDDISAAGVAAFRLAKTADPAAPMWSLKFDNRTPELLYQALHREIDDQIIVSELQGLTFGHFFIERMTHDIDVLRGRHTANYTLTEGAGIAPIIFDTSTFDGTGVFVY